MMFGSAKVVSFLFAFLAQTCLFLLVRFIEFESLWCGAPSDRIAKAAVGVSRLYPGFSFLRSSFIDVASPISIYSLLADQESLHIQ